MPLRIFGLLLLVVITAAGATVALATGAGLPLAWLSLAALAASLALYLRGWR